ncbi:helix-turn-helix domain-containing protein [Thermogutta sp.]|uniref:helix-turn-helix domain-containing protein n=2 Tax=Thermogutta sp. TaxID=1962930 RepID=UPI003C7E6098
MRLAQKNAIELLLAGKTDQEVAEAVRASRQTVTLWRNRDELFQAALDARRHEVWGAQVERLRQLVARAIQVLEDDLHQDEDRQLRQSAAVHILKCVGLYGAHLEPRAPSRGRLFDGWTDAQLEPALKRLSSERGTALET